MLLLPHSSQAIFDSLDRNAIIAITDRHGRITYANPTFCEISGYTPEELHGKDHRILNSGFHSKDFFTAMWKTILAGKTWAGEVRNRNKAGGYYWVQTSISPILNSDGNIDGFLSVRFDITERKTQQEELLQQMKQLGLGTMASGLSHAMNNPLAIAKGKLFKLKDELAKGSNGDSQSMAALGDLDSACTRLGNVVKSLASFAATEPNLLRQPHYFLSLWNSLLSMYQDRFTQAGIELHIDNLPSQDLRINCQHSALLGLFMNLMENSMEAIPQTGPKWIRVDFRRTENQLVTTFSDSGPGIPDENRQRVFEPFYTTKSGWKNVGLGLSVAQSIAKSHEGSLVVQNRAGKTEFVLTLPLF